MGHAVFCWLWPYEGTDCQLFLWAPAEASLVGVRNTELVVVVLSLELTFGAHVLQRHPHCPAGSMFLPVFRCCRNLERALCLAGPPVLSPLSFRCEVEGARHTPPLVAMVSTQQHFKFSADIFQTDSEMLTTQSLAWGRKRKSSFPTPQAGGGVSWAWGSACG